VAGLVGCSESRQASGVLVNAGPFAVTVSKNWNQTAIVEKVPIQALYSREGWNDYLKDRQNIMKPYYACRPQHWAIRFPSALPGGIPFDRNMAGDDETAPQILIHKADEWGLAFTDGEHEERKVADELLSLRKNMDAAMVDGSPFYPPGYMDASLTFVCLKQRIDFAGGHGIRLVTQWTMEPTLMGLGALHYLFLGMSDDNSCQIIATFPLDLPGLPRREDKNHLGRSTENYDEFSRKFEDYVEDAKKWLEMNENEITPSLLDLDKVMQSLVVSHWE
jgi:hypothetical protein